MMDYRQMMSLMSLMMVSHLVDLKITKKLRKEVSWAIRDFKMIEDGDVVMVCISGGKDSFTLLDILLFLKRIAPIHFEVVAVNLDQNNLDSPKKYYHATCQSKAFLIIS